MPMCSLLAGLTPSIPIGEAFALPSYSSPHHAPNGIPWQDPSHSACNLVAVHGSPWLVGPPMALVAPVPIAEQLPEEPTTDCAPVPIFGALIEDDARTDGSDCADVIGFALETMDADGARLEELFAVLSSAHAHATKAGVPTDDLEVRARMRMRVHAARLRSPHAHADKTEAGREAHIEWARWRACCCVVARGRRSSTRSSMPLRASAPC